MSLNLELFQTQLLQSIIPSVKGLELSHLQLSSEIQTLKLLLEKETEKSTQLQTQLHESKEKLAGLGAKHAAQLAESASTIVNLRLEIEELKKGNISSTSTSTSTSIGSISSVSSNAGTSTNTTTETSSRASMKRPANREFDTEARLLNSAVYSLMNFKFETIAEATTNFSSTNILGKGKWGTVFKGDLYGTPIAVKRLPLADKREFEAEISTLCHFRHPNIVQILGFSKGTEYRCLVLELMESGTLRSHLDAPLSSPFGPVLSWKHRKTIALSVARGMEYLQCAIPKVPVFHLDLKSLNILLDSNFTAKIADFGLTKPVPLDERSSYFEKSIQGTAAYVCVEYLKHGIVSKKTDVFSFGIVLLELITGTRAENRLREQVKEEWASEGSIKELLDKSLAPWSEFEINIANQITAAAIDCVDELRSKRPSFSQLVEFLKLASDSTPATGAKQMNDALNVKMSLKEVAARECIICCSAPITCQFIKCFHSATCVDCSKFIVENDEPCPVCRCVVESYVTGSFDKTFSIPLGEKYVPPPMHKKAIPTSSSTRV